PDVFAVLAPARDDVVTLVEFFEQARDIGGVVFGVRAPRGQNMPAGGVDARAHRGGLALVPSQRDDSHAQVLLGDLSELRKAVICRAVVDVNHLVIAPEPFKGFSQFKIELADAVSFVVNGEEDRNLRTSQLPWSGPLAGPLIKVSNRLIIDNKRVEIFIWKIVESYREFPTVQL